MAAPISLRDDFDGPRLRALVLGEKAGSVTRRLLSLVTIYDGGSRADAARFGGVGLQTIRDWVLRFNLRGPDGLVDGKSTGHPSKLNNEQRRALVAMIKGWPDAGDPWGRALEADRSRAMGVRRVSHLGHQTDPEPRTASAELSKTLGAAAPS
jgi:hypothetical protein